MGLSRDRGIKLILNQSRTATFPKASYNSMLVYGVVLDTSNDTSTSVSDLIFKDA